MSGEALYRGELNIQQSVESMTLMRTEFMDVWSAQLSPLASSATSNLSSSNS